MSDRVDRVGQHLGNYRLTRLLDKEGFAEVYLGEHVYLNTQAAIKVLHTWLTSEVMGDFLEEARHLSHLVHPHIVRVLDFGVQESTPFLVMDYAPHGSLRQRHPKGTPVPFSSVVLYVRHVAAALQHAHGQKLIHRDVKPENMLLGPNGAAGWAATGSRTGCRAYQTASPTGTPGTAHPAAHSADGREARRAARQQTLRNTIAWSYDLLTAAEQQLFRRLSVFVGGCTLEAVEALYEILGDAAASVLDEVASLLDKSLLMQIEHRNDEPRLMMLEIIREYGLECLTANGEVETLCDAHAAYYLRLAEEAEPHLLGTEQEFWWTRLDRERRIYERRCNG